MSSLLVLVSSNEGLSNIVEQADFFVPRAEGGEASEFMNRV